jgi:hypothetical protein
MPLAFPHAHILHDRHVVELVHIMLIVRLQVLSTAHCSLAIEVGICPKASWSGMTDHLVGILRS